MCGFPLLAALIFFVFGVMSGVTVTLFLDNVFSKRLKARYSNHG